jgi:hypothetical protein
MRQNSILLFFEFTLLLGEKENYTVTVQCEESRYEPLRVEGSDKGRRW